MYTNLSKTIFSSNHYNNNNNNNNNNNTTTNSNNNNANGGNTANDTTTSSNAILHHISPERRTEMIRYAEVLRNYLATTSNQTGMSYKLAKGFDTAVSRCDEQDSEIKQDRAHAWELLSYYMGEQGQEDQNNNKTFKKQFRSETNPDMTYGK